MNQTNRLLFIIVLLFALSVALLAVKVVQQDERNKRLRRKKRSLRKRRFSHHVPPHFMPLVPPHEVYKTGKCLHEPTKLKRVQLREPLLLQIEEGPLDTLNQRSRSCHEFENKELDFQDDISRISKFEASDEGSGQVERSLLSQLFGFATDWRSDLKEPVARARAFDQEAESPHSRILDHGIFDAPAYDSSPLQKGDDLELGLSHVPSKATDRPDGLHRNLTEDSYAPARALNSNSRRPYVPRLHLQEQNVAQPSATPQNSKSPFQLSRAQGSSSATHHQTFNSGVSKMCRAFMKVQGLGVSRNVSNDLGSDSYFKCSPLDPPLKCKVRKYRTRPTLSGNVVHLASRGLLDNLISEREEEGSGSGPGERGPSKRQSCTELDQQFYNKPQADLEDPYLPYRSSSHLPAGNGAVAEESSNDGERNTLPMSHDSAVSGEW